MTTRFDPKGKYFTKVVSKIPTPTVIQTTHGRIHGMVHLHPEHRLLDELNLPAPFLAVTDARVVDGEEEWEAPFLAVSKNCVVWIVPQEEADDEPQ